MQRDPAAEHSKTDEKRQSRSETICAIGQSLAALDPGPLAELRRMTDKGDDAGASYFWKLASQHGFRRDQEPRWARIVRMMALLTEKGRDEKKASPHEPRGKDGKWRGLGAALCDGGDPSWPGTDAKPRPVYSELRLARLLAAKGDTRAELLERAVRLLASKKPSGAGVDCVAIALLLLEPDNPKHTRDVARDYYARLDRAERQADDDTSANSTSGDDA
jgi:CRISPR system Cascade subunit CasB